MPSLAKLSSPVRAGFDRSNQAAARVILADSVRYPNGCGLRVWALAFLRRIAGESTRAEENVLNAAVQQRLGGAR
jgi:hypothetical protein